MYDARDLTTHGVVVGMTGSGKTGLCISLLEEAAIDGIPCIIIDPKGDLTNLLLQFPDLDPESSRTWLNEEDAQQKGLSKDAYAEAIGRAAGARAWPTPGQSPDRIARLQARRSGASTRRAARRACRCRSSARSPRPKGKMPREALTQKIDATATALLGLTGITADPVQSREHILIAQLL